MMTITYIHHSGFAIETDEACYVFDYYSGDLPEFPPQKPLYVFASHGHSDHWNTGIFSNEKLKKARCFVLGFDIKDYIEVYSEKDPDLLKLPIIWAYPHEEIRTEDFSCVPLLSTDEGVAFPVHTESASFYHAGDLNWWHWNEDPDDANREREINFKREMDHLKGIHFDAAFVPLDPRQENAYRFCMDHCMNVLDADHVFPMHFWKDHDLCRTYHESLREEHPDWYRRFIPISREGEVFSLTD